MYGMGEIDAERRGLEAATLRPTQSPPATIRVWPVIQLPASLAR